jgi:Mg2+/Co2+ transporter CorB
MALLKTVRLAPGGTHEEAKLSPEELRSLVLESAHLMPKKHHAILSSLFELNNITVEDVMTPRGNIEILISINSGKKYTRNSQQATIADYRCAANRSTN